MSAAFLGVVPALVGAAIRHSHSPRTLIPLAQSGGPVAMPEDNDKGKDRARRAQSLARATDLIDQSKREVARSRQIMKESDAADDKADKERDDARWTKAQNAPPNE